MKTFLVAALVCAGVVGVSPARAAIVNLLSDPCFETGSLSPWRQARDFEAHGGMDWHITTVAVHGGNYAAGTDDNYELRQDFTPVAASTLRTVSVWANTTDMAYDLFYTDGTDSEFAFGGADTWRRYDLTSHLDASKMLSGISFFGYTNGVSYIDDAVISTAPVPEPAAWTLMLAGFVVLGAALRGRRGLRDGASGLA